MRERDPLLSIEQVSDWTGLAVQSLYGLRSRGEGPPSLKISNRLRYRESAVENWIREQEAAEADRVSRVAG